MRLILIALLTWGMLSTCRPGRESGTRTMEELVAVLYEASLKPFYHGVASGDPLHDCVIIWTRVTPADSLPKIDVHWEVSPAEDFEPILQQGDVTTGPERDYTVKVDVTGLEAGRTYYYRFRALNSISPAGRTKTIAHDGPDSLRFAVVSCSNWEFGYFNAYDRIAEKSLDAVIHLGDYIYEYGQGGYGNKDIDRKHLPAHEVITLRDYRTRYSQYHLDRGLRKARQQHPFITIWDDHEVANDVYKDGAGNHQSGQEGDFYLRKAAATQAYYEWLPIRESDKLYRSFAFGDLASLIMLDERLEGRSKQLDSLTDPMYGSPTRTMLGAGQLQWFLEELERSEGRWKIVGNQVIFSDLDLSAVSKRRPVNLDSWDGYPAEKTSVADAIRSRQISDIIFLTGDTHSSWAFEVVANASPFARPKNLLEPLAIEFGTTSISSSNSNESSPDSAVIRKEKILMQSNPHLKFTNHRDHGYLLLTLQPDRARAEWFYVETLLRPDNRERSGKRFEVMRGVPRLRELSEKK